MSERKSREPAEPAPLEEVEMVDELSPIEQIHARGKRQLRAGRLMRLNDQLAGGARRPGDEQVGRSPFIMGMLFFLCGLALFAGVMYLLIGSENQKREFEAASTSLDQAKYNDAIQQFERFLVAYPDGEFSRKARILMYTARVRRYTDDNTFSVDSVTKAQEDLEEFVRVCRDLPEYQDEHDNLVRYSRKISDYASQVAIDRASQQALDVSQKAFEQLQRWTAAEGLSAEVRERIRSQQERAEAEILKQNTLKDSLAQIRTGIESGDTLGALETYQQLTSRYPVLEGDAEFRQALTEIRNREQGLIVTEELGIEGVTEDYLGDQRPYLSLNLRTQAASGRLSQGELVFGSGGDVVFALDSQTGDPVWKRNIGAQAPFAPVPVQAVEPSLLLFHSGTNELLLVTQSDGALVWRQSVEAPPTGPPLVVEQQIYVTTENGYLWLVSAVSGRAVSRVRFSQPVQGPPALSRDRNSLVIPGRSAFVYTLSRRPLECRAVSWLAHREGSVASPMIAMGELFLMCENHTAEQSRLWALEFSGDGQLTAREQRTIDGLVWDASLLRGDQLYVPSIPQRVTAFRVSDRIDNDALSVIGTNQLEDAEESSVFLLAGPGGNLWMASTALRRFQVNTDAVLLDDAVVARGQHLFPMQTDSDGLLVTTNEPYSSSVFFTRVNRDSMQGEWRTVLSTNLVAVGQSATGNSLIAISDFGQIFRVPLQQVAEPTFHTEAVSQFRLPDGLQDPVGGLELPDGRLAAWCGGKEPTMWTTSATGQLEQRWPLRAAPQVDPVPLAGGVVVPVPGGLQLVGSRQRVDEYRVQLNAGQRTAWKALVAVSDTQVVAVNSDNQLVQVEYRGGARPHLAEVSVIPLDGETELKPAAGGDYLAIVTVDGRLVLLRSSTMEDVREVSLGDVVSRPPRISGDRVFVEIADQSVAVYELNSDLSLLGSFDRSGELVGPPLPLGGGGFLAGFSDGTVMRLNSDGQPEGEPVSIGQRLQRGPIAAGGSVLVMAADGSLYFLNDLTGN